LRIEIVVVPCMKLSLYERITHLACSIAICSQEGEIVFVSLVALYTVIDTIMWIASRSIRDRRVGEETCQVDNCIRVTYDHGIFDASRHTV